MRRSPSRDVRFSVPHQAACLSLADRRPKRVPTQLALSCARPIPATVACRPPCGMDGESMGQDWRGGISICRAREERGNVGLFHGKGWGIANCIGWLISNRNPSSARSLPSGTTRPGGAPSPSGGGVCLVRDGQLSTMPSFFPRLMRWTAEGPGLLPGLLIPVQTASGQPRWASTASSSKATILVILIIGLTAGPAVSL
jgi:hypothetical protein